MILNNCIYRIYSISELIPFPEPLDGSYKESWQEVPRSPGEGGGHQEGFGDAGYA